MSTDTADLVTAYTDQLLHGPPRGAAPSPGEDPALPGLIDLVNRLYALFQPMRPRAAYRDQLRRRLLIAAQDQIAAAPLNPWRQHRVGLLIGAAALGSAVSVAGVIAYLLHTRANHRDVQAACG